MPTARDLRDRVRFERMVLDDEGQPTDEWATLITSRRAALTPMRPKAGTAEQVIAARSQGVALFDLWVRWDSETVNVGPTDRAVDLNDTNRVFNIEFVQDMDARQTWLLMQVKLGVASG